MQDLTPGRGRMGQGGVAPAGPSAWSGFTTP